MSGLYTSRGHQGAPMRSSTVQPDRTAGTHTPASPAQGGRGAVGQGAFAHAGPVFRLTPAPALIQRFPYKYEHTQLHRTFHLTNNGNRLQMDEVGNNLDPYSGWAQYDITDDTLTLAHIESDPEAGSGIGSLLMYHLGHLAEDRAIPQVFISMPAATAVGFYEMVGAQSPQPEQVREAEGRIGADDELVQETLARNFAHLARVKYNTHRDNRIAGRGFGQLPPDEQQRLIAAEAEAFNNLSKDDQERTKAAWIHGRAVSSRTLMVASPGTILARTTASVNNKWQEQPLTLGTRDRLLGKKNLVTLVSRAGNKYMAETGLLSRPSKQTVDAIEVLGTLVGDYDNMADAVRWYLGMGPAPDGVAVTEKLKQGSRFQTLLLAAWQEYTG